MPEPECPLLAPVIVALHEKSQRKLQIESVLFRNLDASVQILKSTSFANFGINELETSVRDKANKQTGNSELCIYTKAKEFLNICGFHVKCQESAYTKAFNKTDEK